MFRVTREIHFCYGHRLLNYEGKCRRLHGHNGRGIITFQTSGLDHRGMVVDFAEIKRTISEWIDEQLDHRLLLCRDDPLVDPLRKLGEAPFVMDENPTAENIARLIYEFTASRGFPVAEVQLWETPRCGASYCPGDRDESTMISGRLKAEPLAQET
ncbi:MAG TPA: 6-carboxytetrahydropterin synthase [Planctomycetaceae bacterium]|nr:6-carboxytetrahydropterin synthase [Planctomycetaceae bacterium]